MGYVLIAPEMVICWAARQHFAARHLAKKYQGRGWMMAHGFFLVMGGFTLHDQRGKPLRILVPRELDVLSDAGKIRWPSITEAEIQDRSKGDYLSKAFVLVQTSWFIAQCIVRGAYGLAVTELEVATLAFAALSGVTYYLWCHKPLDVRCSVPVYLRELCEDREDMSVSFPIPHQPIEDFDAKEEQVDPRSSKTEERDISLETLVSPDPELNPREPNTSNSTLVPPHNDSTTAPEPNLTHMQWFSAFIQQQQRKHGTLLGLAYVFIIHPLFAFFRAFREMLGSCTLHDSSPFRVPTFYAPITNDGVAIPIATGVTVAIVFGCIHCVAWSFRFPSLQEQLAWRISAASVLGLPIFMFVSGFLVQSIFETGGEVTVYALTVIYVIARIVLLILPCIALRALPASAFVDIQWTFFSPHLG
jgi:hypothetical protein